METSRAFHIQPDCQTSAHAIPDFAKGNYNAGLESRSAAFDRPLRVGAITTRSRLLQKTWGKSERKSSERGLSGLQSEDTSFTASCCLPYPNSAKYHFSAYCH